MNLHTDPSVRHDMVMLFDIADGNPNGDPDAANRPRVDSETGQGLVTDVALKRKIRDTLPLLAIGREGYETFVSAGLYLNTRLEDSYAATGLVLDPVKKNRKEEDGKTAKKATLDAGAAREWLCRKYFDIRLFGAVLSTGRTSALGQIRGPLQVSFARSLDPVTPVEHTITRIVHTTESDAVKESGPMGNKWTLPYGLYQATISYSAIRGAQTGVTERDLELLYASLVNLFEHTSSAARANMATRALHVFTHDDAFGKAPMHALVDRVHVHKVSGVEVPRSVGDYSISVDLANLPAGVSYVSLA